MRGEAERGDPAGEVGRRDAERLARVHAERLGARDGPAPRALGEIGRLGAALAHLVPPAAHRAGDEEHPEGDPARAADQLVQQ